MLRFLFICFPPYIIHSFFIHRLFGRLHLTQLHIDFCDSCLSSFAATCLFAEDAFIFRNDLLLQSALVPKCFFLCFKLFSALPCSSDTFFLRFAASLFFETFSLFLFGFTACFRLLFAQFFSLLSFREFNCIVDLVFLCPLFRFASAEYMQADKWVTTIKWAIIVCLVIYKLSIVWNINVFQIPAHLECPLCDHFNAIWNYNCFNSM